MKKRILALACAMMLVLGTTMAASAASPTAKELLAPRVDIVIDLEETSIAPIAVSKNTVKIADTPGVFKLGVMEALQVCMGKGVKVLNILDCKTLKTNAASTPVALSVPGVTSADWVLVLAYNETLKNWEFVPAASLADEVYTVLSNVHSKVVFMVNGKLPEALRFSAEASEAAVVEYLESVDTIDGGKDINTAMEVSASALEAPFTGEAQMTVVVFAALVFAAAFVVSRKRLVAFN